MELLAEAVTALRAIARFWLQIEIDIGTFDDHGPVAAGEVTPTWLAVLQLCIDTYADGLPDGDGLLCNGSEVRRSSTAVGAREGSSTSG